MEEIAPGVFHWKAVHPKIDSEVSSYYLADSGTLLDPMVPPEEGLEWFDERRPERIVLTNRHHYRDADRFRERFDIPVSANEVGLHEFKGGRQVDGLAIGEEVAPGVTAYEFGSICPDDTALHIASGPAFLAFADGIIHYGGLGFVGDQHMEDPGEVKSGIYANARTLLDLDFDGLLFAHGDPQPAGGKEALRRFVEQGQG